MTPEEARAYLDSIGAPISPEAAQIAAMARSARRDAMADIAEAMARAVHQFNRRQEEQVK